jgi:hypothetical protein
MPTAACHTVHVASTFRYALHRESAGGCTELQRSTNNIWAIQNYVGEPCTSAYQQNSCDSTCAATYTCHNKSGGAPSKDKLWKVIGCSCQGMASSCRTPLVLRDTTACCCCCAAELVGAGFSSSCAQHVCCAGPQLSLCSHINKKGK